ncbi:MAG: nuclear transport factor 2 family protein [Acidobacteriota bacterium]
MRRIVFATAVISALSVFVITGMVSAESAGQPCIFDGTYRIDVDESDRLYSVVREATSSVPFSEQQQFFMDLSVRLTPPDILAIECRGTRVSIGSSRARKITFVADGASRTGRSASGGVVRSKVSMAADTLTFTSSGRAEDSVNVAFRSLDGGRRLEVIRRIGATQLSEPIVIRSVYDRVAGGATWDARGDIAGTPDTSDDVRATAGMSASAPRSRQRSGSGEAAELRNALDEWIGATNKRDIETQMRFYLPRLDAYYLSRNTPRSAVMSEKRRVFSTARSIDIRAEEPEIVFQDGGRTAVMRFNKKYRIADKGRTKSGEVVQELRWRRTGDGWRIYSERDVKVLR